MLRVQGAANGNATSAAHNPLTRLSFVGHADTDANGTFVGSRRRRLALRDGVRLGGNLHTLGYFAADICVGTPPKVFNLIVGARCVRSRHRCARFRVARARVL